jgi:hypothetical protein
MWWCGAGPSVARAWIDAKRCQGLPEYRQEIVEVGDEPATENRSLAFSLDESGVCFDRLQRVPSQASSFAGDVTCEFTLLNPKR